jgi:hypothetical protein
MCEDHKSEYLCCIIFAFPFVFIDTYFSCHCIGWVVSSFLGGKEVS